MDSKYDDPPSMKALDEGYNQTYIIMDREQGAAEDVGYEVLFRCGNWCYKGLVQFNDLKINLEDVPVVIPTLQRQQGSLRYFCTAKSVPPTSEYNGPMRYMEKTLDFIAHELTSEAVEKELLKMSAVFPWIEDDGAATYFELAVNTLPACMEKVRLIASKTYTQGLVIISMYYANAIYCVLLQGEGDQPLLDVRFPDVSKHNQGVMLNSYNHSEFRKLTLWHNIAAPNQGAGVAALVKKDLPKLKTVDLSHKNYEQTYVILHSAMEAATGQLSSYHDVMFRFGSWCYSGRVQLTAQLCLYDVPYVIPALRMQQSRLDFVCDVTALPVTSPFALIMQYIRRASESVEEVLLKAEGRISEVLLSCGNDGQSDSSDAAEEGAFFEFSLAFPQDLSSKLSNVEMVVSKTYHPSGIVTVTIFYQNTLYVCLQDSTRGEHPLLDSRFPMLQYQSPHGEPDSSQAVGYALQNFDEGLENWPELRKVTLWVTPTAVDSPVATKPNALFAAEAKTTERSPTLLLTDGTAAKQSKDPLEKEDSKASLGATPPLQTTHPAGTNAEAKSDSKSGQAALLADAWGSPSGFKQALPHHLPKLSDPLSHKLESIRNAMGDEGMRAPWDLRGKPLGKVGDFK